MPYRLRFTSGKSKGSYFALEPGKVLTIGRSPSNDICIPDTKISRIHCQIEFVGDTCHLTDLNSSNGTFVDGERTDEEALKEGGTFHLGFTTVVFEPYEEDGERLGSSEAGKEEDAGLPRALLCSECGRAIFEDDITKGDAREIGTGVYCGVCSKEFADVELVEDGSSLADDAREEAEALGMDTHPSLDPLVGQIISGCELLEKVAEGPMGNVYRADQKSMDREVALRVLSRGPETSDKILDQMIDRARLSGRLSHPQIVVVHDLGQQGSLYYVCMELITGDSVRDMLLKHKRLQLPDALYVACHAARGLHWAWQQGIVHGDVHPGNILVDKLGQSKLTDFGPVPEPIMANMRPARQLAYLRYMAPERLVGKKYDISADLYSLGAILYHMVCGQPPLDGDTVEDLRLQVARAEPPPPSSLNEEAPQALDDMVMALLAKSPGDRPESAAAVARTLRDMVKALRPSQKEG